MKLKKDVFMPLPKIEIEAAHKTIASTFERLGRLVAERTELANEIKKVREENEQAQGITIRKGREYTVGFTLVRSSKEGMKEFLFPLEAIEIRKLAADTGRMDAQGFLLDSESGERFREPLTQKEDRSLPDLETGPIVEQYGTINVPVPPKLKLENVVKKEEPIDFTGLSWEMLLNNVIETLNVDNLALFRSDEKAPEVAASVIFLYESYDISDQIEESNREAIDAWKKMSTTPPSNVIDRLGWVSGETDFDTVIKFIEKWKPVFPKATPIKKAGPKQVSSVTEYLEAMYSIAQALSYQQKLIRYWNSKMEGGGSANIPAPDGGKGDNFPKMKWVDAKKALDKWKVEVYDKPPGPPADGLPAGVIKIEGKEKSDVNRT